MKKMKNKRNDLLRQVFFLVLATGGFLVTLAIVGAVVEFTTQNFDLGCIIIAPLLFFFCVEFRFHREFREKTLTAFFAYTAWVIERRNIMSKTLFVALTILAVIAVYGKFVKGMICSDRPLGYGIVMIGFTLIVFGILREAYKAVVDDSPMKYNHN